MGILQKLFGRDPNEPKGAFFLEPDDAKTYGDIDYMRKPAVIKRTFAKTISGGGGEVVQSISSIEKRRLEEAREEGKQQPVAKSAFGATAPSPKPASTERRKPASGGSSGDLDFRNMARGIKKR